MCIPCIELHGGNKDNDKEDLSPSIDVDPGKSGSATEPAIKDVGIAGSTGNNFFCEIY